MAAGRTTCHYLIAVIQSAKTVTSPMAAFRLVAVPRSLAVLGMLEVGYLSPRIGAIDPKRTYDPPSFELKLGAEIQHKAGKKNI